MFILLFRIAFLQINQYKKLSNLGKKNFLQTEFLAPLRGNILDCNEILLASNRPVFDLYWKGSGFRKLSSEQKNYINQVKDILEFEFNGDLSINKIATAEKYSKKIMLKSDINFDQLCQICEQCANASNLLIVNRFKRFYPYGSLASHILGYLNRQEEKYTTVGIYGLEKMFQDELKGEVGYILNIINSRGRKLDQKEFKNPKSGNDIRLTLDCKSQLIAETLFEKDQTGVFILMDPENGAIKVLLSYPNFNPNIFLKPISQDEWSEKLAYNSPLLNRVTNASYPPASIFKLVTFAAGLEEGIITPESEFKCKGYVSFCGRRYHCIRRWGHGDIDAKIALAYSCNIPCYNIAKKIKINQLADYAFRFGLGRPTGFLLPEGVGLIPTYEWKVAVKNEPWWKGETFSASIGQSYLLVTPLQMARMISGICSGYLVKPRILEQEEIEKEELEISTSTLEFLKEAMKDVVYHGSARILGKIKDFEIHAKTGTAQTIGLEKEKVSKEQLEHAWLASFFYYKKQKPLVMIVLVENAGTAEPAKNIAAKFLKAYSKLQQMG